MRGLIPSVTLGMLLFTGCGKKPETETVKKSVTTTENAPKPKSDTTPTSKPPEPKQNPPSKSGAGEKEGLSVTSDALSAEYKENRLQTLAKYAGKTLEITGDVQWVQSLVGRPPTILFKCVEERGIKREDSIAIYADGIKDPEIWEKVARGSHITIRAKLPQDAKHLDFTDTLLVKAGPNPTEVISATEIAKQCRMNADQAEKKWDNKYVYLEGILEVGMPPDGNLHLEGDGDWKVDGMIYSGPNKTKDLKKGQKIKLYGQIRVNPGAKLVMVSTDFFVAK